MTDREKVINGLHCCAHTDGINCIYCPYDNADEDCTALMSMDVLELLKEQEAVEPKTIPEELMHKMWNALYAEENKFEKKYVGTKEHNSWFLIYRPWLQEGFNLAIKAIADWEGR